MNTNFEKISENEITFVIQGPIIKASDATNKSSDFNRKFIPDYPVLNSSLIRLLNPLSLQYSIIFITSGLMLGSPPVI